MCTSPIMINRKIAGKVYPDVVPCGKCHECLSKNQNEFAALAVLEAKKSKSMYMCALTYRNNTCPIMVTQKNDYGEFIRKEFCVGRERYDHMPDMVRERTDRRGRLIKYLEGYSTEDDVNYYPSLDRENLRLFLKRTRQAYKREYGFLPKFRYAAFGEYGDEFHRPHTHFLFFDLSDQDMFFFRDAWQKDFGYMDVQKIPILNRDGSPARVKVSKYVSKYLRKPREDFKPLLDELCEKPRLLVSRNFGKGVLPDNLKSFYLCEDLSHLSFEERAQQVLERKKSLVIDGVKFPLPRSIKKDYFYDTTKRIRFPFKPRVFDFSDTGLSKFVEEGKGLEPLRANGKRIYKLLVPERVHVLETDSKRSALSVKVASFARDRYNEDSLRQLRSYIEANSDLSDRVAFQKFCENERIALEDRVQYAKNIYLQHLKKQKYG